MQSRVLRKILNNTKYTICDEESYIAIGSPMCHNLISVDKKTFEFKLALDTFNEGRKSLENDKRTELLFIYDKLKELVQSGQLKEIIEGNDVIDNPLPVYYFKNGKVIKTFTDAYGWPNTTIEGYLMYENTFFKTPKEAVEKAIDEQNAGIRHYSDRLKGLTKDINENEAKLAIEKLYLTMYEELLSKI